MQKLIGAVQALQGRLIQLDKSYRSSLKIDSSKNIYQYRPDPLVKRELNNFLTALSDIIEQFYELQRNSIKHHIPLSELTKLKEEAWKKDAPKTYPAAHKPEHSLDHQHQTRIETMKMDYKYHLDLGKELPLKYKARYSVLTLGLAIPFFAYNDVKKIPHYIRYSREKRQENKSYKRERSLLESSKVDTAEFELYQSIYSFYRTLYQNPIKKLYLIYNESKNEQKKKEPEHIPSANPAPSNVGAVCNNDHFMTLPEEESSSYSDEDILYEYEARKPSAPPLPAEYFEDTALDDTAYFQNKN